MDTLQAGEDKTGDDNVGASNSLDYITEINSVDVEDTIGLENSCDLFDLPTMAVDMDKNDENKSATDFSTESSSYATVETASNPTGTISPPTSITTSRSTMVTFLLEDSSSPSTTMSTMISILPVQGSEEMGGELFLHDFFSNLFILL